MVVLVVVVVFVVVVVLVVVVVGVHGWLWVWTHNSISSILVIGYTKETSWHFSDVQETEARVELSYSITVNHHCVVKQIHSIKR